GFEKWCPLPLLSSQTSTDILFEYKGGSSLLFNPRALLPSSQSNSFGCGPADVGVPSLLPIPMGPTCAKQKEGIKTSNNASIAVWLNLNIVANFWLEKADEVTESVDK